MGPLMCRRAEQLSPIAVWTASLSQQEDKILWMPPGGRLRFASWSPPNRLRLKLFNASSEQNYSQTWSWPAGGQAAVSSPTWRSTSSLWPSCGWSVRSSSRCRSPRPGRPRSGRTWARTLEAPWTGLTVEQRNRVMESRVRSPSELNNSLQTHIIHLTGNYKSKPTFLMSSRQLISGESPPWTHRNCWLSSAARGRQSKASMQAS